jgi:hypothetical protein
MREAIAGGTSLTTGDALLIVVVFRHQRLCRIGSAIAGPKETSGPNVLLDKVLGFLPGVPL